MTIDDVKGAANRVVDALSGYPILLVFILVMVGVFAVSYYEIDTQRARIGVHFEDIEKHRHQEVMGTLETVRSCQSELASVAGNCGVTK